MKKLLSVLFVLGVVAVGLNFSGVQSLNGLHTTSVFTAPTGGFYFINGSLQLPWSSGNGNTGASEVVATVLNGATPLYVGVSGASGFQVRHMSLATGDAISVRLQSNAAIDQPLNAVKGQVNFGNGN